MMKNHGYELEHNFGHGKQYLAMTLATLNLLAFAWHSILDLAEPPWRTARDVAGKRTSFFSDLWSITRLIVFPNWQTLLKSLAASEVPRDLLKAHDLPC
ncbi:MAG: hypothetical protein HC902_14520 [Calothrix sp. SM1_5_4]|nr:hypothetical protein [Calothrix sp. SM1_5_4]